MNGSTTRHFLVISAVIALSLRAAAGQCVPQWSAAFPNCPFDAVTSIFQYDADGAGPNPPLLIVGGQRQVQGAPPGDVIATWNGSTWGTVGSGLIDGPWADVAAMVAYDEDGPGGNPPALFAAGSFNSPGQPNYIARWNGTQWSAVGGGLTSYVTGMTTWDPDGAGPQRPLLVVSGSWFIKTWDGVVWTDITQGPIAVPLSIVSFDPDGDGPQPPQLIRGMPTWYGEPQVQRWTGASWVPLGDSTNGSFIDARVKVLLVVDPDGPGPALPVLYAAGRMNSIGSTPIRSVAKWDGVQWSAVGFNIDVNDEVMALAWFDEDGAGPTPASLYAGQGMNLSLGRFDGAQWVTVGSGFSGYTYSSIAISDSAGSGLYVGGDLFAAGGSPARGLVRWGCPTCYANCDHSAVAPILNANDFQCFLNAFAAALPYANCDGSISVPVLTANDFQCFLNRYASGCP